MTNKARTNICAFIQGLLVTYSGNERNKTITGRIYCDLENDTVTAIIHDFRNFCVFSSAVPKPEEILAGLKRIGAVGADFHPHEPKICVL